MKKELEPSPLKFNLSSDRKLIAKEVPSARVLQVDVDAPLSDKQDKRMPLNLGLVIDRSGSMQGEKLAHAKRAAIHVVDLLQECDRVAVVIFDSAVETLVSNVEVTPASRQMIRERINQVESRASTDLGGGWLQGCHEVAEFQKMDLLNRVLLLTDGLANVGMTDPEQLAGHARELANRGISTSTIGIGMGYNEHLLEGMANQGDGHYYFIENPVDIPGIFEREFKELSAVTARQVKVSIKVPVGVDVQVLGSWRNVLTDGTLEINLGNLFSSQHQEIFIKLLTPPMGEKSKLTITGKVSAMDENDKALNTVAAVEFKYAPRAEADAEAADAALLSRFAPVEVASVATNALQLERAGRREEAGRLMDDVLRINACYMVLPQRDYYEKMTTRMKHGMDEYDRKLSHSMNYMTKRKHEQQK